MTSLRVRLLLQSLRGKGVNLISKDGRLHIDASAGVLTDALRASLAENKEDLIELLERERAKLERANEIGFFARYSKHPGYIALHDSATGEWHDFPESSCLPGIVEDAKAFSRPAVGRKRRDERGGAA